MGLPGGRVRAVLQPDHDADRHVGGHGLGVGQEIRHAGDGAEQGDEARRRHPLQVRPTAAAAAGGRRRRGGRGAGRHLRGTVLAGGTAQARPGRDEKGLTLFSVASLHEPNAAPVFLFVHTQ